MMLQGHLNEFPLSEIARLLCATSKTGGLMLKTPHGQGSIHLAIGQMTAAEFNRFFGLDALEEIAAQTDGTFEFIEGQIPAQQNLSSLPTVKLLEALERINTEERKIAQLMPEAQDIPRYLPGQLPGDFQASTEDLALALATRGTNSIAEIAAQAGVSVDQARHTFARFRSIGFVDLVGRKTVDRPEAPRPTPTGPLPTRTWRGRPIK